MDMVARSERLNARMLPPPTPVSMSSSFAMPSPPHHIQAPMLAPSLPRSPASTTSALRSPGLRTAPRPLSLRHTWKADSDWSNASASSAGSDEVHPAVKAIMRKLLVLKAEINDKLWDLRRSLTADGVEAVEAAAAKGITGLMTDIRSLTNQLGH